MSDQDDFDTLVKERFQLLPKVVQDAITSADVEKRLRELAEGHKLHLDQWQLLENEVHLTLLGVKPVEDLEVNIKNEVLVPEETAHELAEGISKIVFEPIREELERQLEHPEAKAAQVSGIDAARDAILANTENASGAATPGAHAQNTAPVPAAPAPVAPATPPQPAPEAKAQRAQISPAPTPSVPSHERKDIEGDPYREQVV